MDVPDIQKLYELCCDSYYALLIIDWLPPIITRSGSKRIPVCCYLLLAILLCDDGLSLFSRTFLVYATESLTVEWA